LQKVIGVDVGGTFTDVLYIDEQKGEGRIAKVSSTPKDQSIGLVRGVLKAGANLTDLELIVHGTTVATNSLLERKGSFCGLITTKGFRDILELRRRDRPDQYGLRGSFKPLVERERRLEANERTNAEGEILKEVSEDEIRSLAKKLLKAGVECVVVSFLHSYANPHNELKAKRVLESLWPNHYVVIASDVLPEYREFDRTTTAVANAYVQPIIDRYLQELYNKLLQNGYKGDVLLVESNGGLMSLDVSRKYPVNTVLSGPAAGVIAASYIADVAGFKNSISLDMGGTSLDVCLILDGKPYITTGKELEYSIPIIVPMIDITTIGAGGGSIAWVDKAGILQIGPQSAGADPGPACYGKGGEEATVTDANIVLGRISPDNFIGREEGLSVDIELAQKAVMEKVGSKFGLNVYEASNAIIEVANNKMASSVRLVSIDRGYDPRDFVLTAFGGAGPLHALGIIKKIGLRRVVVPYYPGITCAFGCIMANMRHDFVQTINKRIDNIDLNIIKEILEGQQERGKNLLKEEKVHIEKVMTIFEADMMYEGQTHVIRPNLPSPSLSKDKLKEVFEKEYEARYKLLLDWAPITLMSLRTTVIGVRPRIRLDTFFSQLAKSGKRIENAVKGTRKVYIDGRFIETKIYERTLIPSGAQFEGPAIIEQSDATTYVDPKTLIKVDQYGNLILEVS
jgi:N-methylhydantoinase A